MAQIAVERGDTIHIFPSEAFELTPALSVERLPASDFDLSNTVERPELVRDGRLMPDGGFVLSVARQNRLLVFDSAGILIDSLGGRGNGPGEFASMSRLRLSKSSYLVHDGANGRLTWFRGGGHDEFSLARDSQSAALTELVGITDDDAAVMLRSMPSANREGLHHDSAQVYLVTRAGTSTTAAGLQLRGQDQFVGPRSAGGFAALITPPFGVATHSSVCGDRLSWSLNTDVEIRTARFAGGALDQEIGVLRLTLPRPEIDQNRIRAMLSKRLGGREVESGLIEQIQSMTSERLLPALASLRCDRSGGLIVEGFHDPLSDSYTLLWITGEHRVAHRIEIPESLTLLDATESHILLLGDKGEGFPLIRRVRVQ